MAAMMCRVSNTKTVFSITADPGGVWLRGINDNNGNNRITRMRKISETFLFTFSKKWNDFALSSIRDRYGWKLMINFALRS